MKNGEQREVTAYIQFVDSTLPYQVQFTARGPRGGKVRASFDPNPVTVSDDGTVRTSLTTNHRGTILVGMEVLTETGGSAGRRAQITG